MPRFGNQGNTLLAIVICGCIFLLHHVLETNDEFTYYQMMNINIGIKSIKSSSQNMTIIKAIKHIKKEVVEFGQSLFCNISQQSDQEKYGKILNDIYQIQMNHSCDIHQKYYIMSMDDLRTNRGFVSFIDHEYTPPFALSLFLNRTFVFLKNTDRKPWIYLPKNGKTIPNLCQNRTGKDCIFRPVSNCTSEQIGAIIRYAKDTNNYTTIDYKHLEPKICRKSKRLNADSFHELTKDYMVIVERFECNLFWNHGESMNRGLIQRMINERNWQINYFEFNSIIWSLLMRMQQNIKDAVEKIVKESLVKYEWKSKQRSVSVVIRGSDKCEFSETNKTFFNKAEMDCFDPQTFLDVVGVINESQNGLIDSVIVTTEDKNIMQFMKNVSKNENGNGMKFVFNDGDVMQSCGLVQDLNAETQNDEGKMLKMMLSMLSTIKLQMHSNFYVIQKESNWAHAIWTLSSCIHCQLEQSAKAIANEERYCANLQNKSIILDPAIGVENNQLPNVKLKSDCYRESRFK